MDDGALRPPHHPAIADWHFLRPGGEDQCGVFHTRQVRQGQYQGRLGLRFAEPNGGLWQDASADRKGLRGVRKSLRRRSARQGKAQGSGGGGAVPVHRRDEIKARNDNLDIGWLRDTEAEPEEHLAEPDDMAAAIIGHLEAALEEIDAVSEELTGEEEEAEALEKQGDVA